MNIIAIDTLSSTLSVAAQGPKGLFTQSFTGNAPSHAEQLLPLIESAVRAAGFTAAETGLVLTPEGPGSFTGLRLGFAAAKALQLSTHARFIPIPTLSCIAFQYQGWEDNLAALIDAKRDRFYIQLFKNGTATTEVFDKTAAEMLPYFSQDSLWLITGYGTAAFRNTPVITEHSSRFRFLETDTLTFAPAMLAYAQKHAAVLAEAQDYAGPAYIRKSDAEKE